MNFNTLDFILIGVLSSLVSHVSTSPCEEWTPFEDEDCFEIQLNLVSEPEAENLCKTLNSKLAVIRNEKQEQFIINFLNNSKLLYNVWIGLKKQNNSFKWTDNSTIEYTNWLTNKTINEKEDCVEISLSKNEYGKWNDQPCNKKNVVLCQKKQQLSLESLQKSFFEYRKMSTDRISKLESLNENLNTNLNSLKDSVYVSTSIPIGFIYTQLSEQKEPAQIWPKLKWIDITGNYSGLFFRAGGGGAADFGKTQNEQTQHLTSVDFCYPCSHSMHNKISIVPGTWSNLIDTGTGPGTSIIGLQFLVSEGEIRPKNQAIKIWKRI